MLCTFAYSPKCPFVEGCGVQFSRAQRTKLCAGSAESLISTASFGYNIFQFHSGRMDRRLLWLLICAKILNTLMFGRSLSGKTRSSDR